MTDLCIVVGINAGMLYLNKTMKSKIKTSWNFQLFYKNDKDPQIQKDIELYKKAIVDFDSSYKNSDAYLKKADALLKACSEYESIVGMKEGMRPLMYFHYKRDINSNDKASTAKLSELSDVYQNIVNKILFFRLNLGKISKEQQAVFLGDESLKKYYYFLKVIFDNARYELSESEEKIINLLGKPAYDMWVSGFSKLLSNQEVVFKGKKLPINQAMGMTSDLPTKDRRKLHDTIMNKLVEISDFSESEINAVVSKKKITDELRGYEKPYSSVIKRYENEDETVENLVDVVTKNFKISHRFFKLKAKLLKEKTLQYADRGAKVGTTKRKFEFAETVEIIRSAFGKFDPKFQKIFDSYLENGQVDVAPRKGKKGGAYCSGAYGLPTFVLLNHADTFNSVMTYGHEMGHAFHTELSQKAQGPISADYTIAVAEVASTLFENFVFEEVFEKLSTKEKIIALHDKINSQISTVFRQIACFNFEKELHDGVRTKGYLSKDEIAEVMNTHMQSYLGPAFKLKKEDGYFFVTWQHIRYYFYVYSYAFGSLISDALFAEYKKDKNFIVKIEEFLSAGGSKSPEDIFASVGIDIRKPDFFKKGLEAIEKQIEKLEELVKKDK